MKFSNSDQLGKLIAALEKAGNEIRLDGDQIVVRNIRGAQVEVELSRLMRVLAQIAQGECAGAGCGGASLCASCRARGALAGYRT